MAFNRSIGHTLLAVWLILYGLSSIIALSFQGFPLIMGILALIAGICLLIGK